MGRMPRPCATTAPATRRKTQNSQKSIAKLPGSLLYIPTLTLNWRGKNKNPGNIGFFVIFFGFELKM